MSQKDIVGKYAYVDVVFNGNSGETRKMYGNITINPDEEHMAPGFQQNNVEVNDDEESSKPTWLLAIAGISGIGAGILGIMIVFGNKDEN